MTGEERAVIIEVLCSQALADHLGDVRDAEKKLWELLGVDSSYGANPDIDFDEPWPTTRDLLRKNGLALPTYLADEDDEDDEGGER